MARYIDIDKMREWDRESNGCDGIENCLGKRFSDCRDCYYDHGGAEDVAPVVHAKWERLYERIDYIFICSACMEISPVVDRKYNFCPNCGAKMDKE